MADEPQPVAPAEPEAPPPIITADPADPEFGKKFAAELPMVLYNHLRETKTDHSKDKFHISGVGGCYRKQILERAGYLPRPTRNESLAVFEYGHKIESMIRKAFNWYGPFTVHTHGHVAIPEYDALGTFDMLLTFKNKRILLDVKSANGRSFGFNLDRGNDKYRMQLAGYAIAIEHGGYTITDRDVPWMGPMSATPPQKTIGPFEVDETMIFYVDKEYGQTAVDCFKREPCESQVCQYLGNLNKYWNDHKKTGTLPPEINLLPAPPTGKHVKNKRVKPGELAPDWMCSPQYCEQICYCPLIKKWWEEKGNFPIDTPAQPEVTDES